MLDELVASPAWREAFEALGVSPSEAGLAAVKKVVLAGMLKKRVPAAPLCARIDTLAPLARCPALVELDLTRSPVSDLTPLAGLEHLKTLVLWGTKVGDLSPLAGKRKLQVLAVWCTPVEDLSPLASTPALAELNVEYTGVHDLSPLRGLRKLRTLNVSGTAVTDPTPLDAVPLTQLVAYRSALTPSAIEAFRATHPDCRIEAGDAYPTREVRCGC